MGFVLSLLYLVIYYLTPTTVFGQLAVYRIELIVAVLVMIASLPRLAGSIIFKTPQSLALIGFAFATLLSVVIGAHWLSGGITAFLLFIPNAFAYYLVCLHCDSRKRLQLLVLAMLFVCFFVLGQGLAEMHRGLPEGGSGDSDSDSAIFVNSDTSYFVGMSNDQGQWFYRLRGMGEINDPNDYAQLLVSVLPLVFIFWRPRQKIRNFLFVIVPSCILLYATYLTHSRGSMLALAAIAIVASRRRIGTIPALVLAAGLFAGASALHFTGGREISASAGEDRTALWGDGLQLLKTHPLFGVGFGDMPDYAGQTAHNSIVVCAAELGLFGMFFWTMYLFPTVRDAVTLSSTRLVGEPRAPAVSIPPSTPFATQRVEVLDRQEITRLGRLMVLSFTGFFVTGWFLSRAYLLTLFLLGGMTEVVFEMALQRGMVGGRLRIWKIASYSSALALILVLVMYIMVRIVNLTH